MFFKLEFKTGVGGGFLRAFTSQKGPGKGLPASGFAPERRNSTAPPDFDYAEDIDAERFWDTGRLGGERFAHTGWSKFIRRIIRSDVNTFKTTLS